MSFSHAEFGGRPAHSAKVCLSRANDTYDVFEKSVSRRRIGVERRHFTAEATLSSKDAVRRHTKIIDARCPHTVIYT